MFCVKCEIDGLDVTVVVIQVVEEYVEGRRGRVAGWNGRYRPKSDFPAKIAVFQKFLLWAIFGALLILLAIFRSLTDSRILTRSVKNVIHVVIWKAKNTCYGPI